MTPAEIASVGAKLNRAYHLQRMGSEDGAKDNPLPDWLTKALNEALKDAPSAAAVTPKPGAFVAVRYIGHRATYVDGAYGTRLLFAQGESKLVPAKEAALMLKHKDVYEPGEVPAETPAPMIAEKKKDESDEPAQMMRDAIANMNKAACAQHAKVHFNIELDSTMKVGEMRSKLVGLIDQYGIE